MRSAVVVDDEPGIREVFQYFLTRQGYTVRTAADGQEAVREILHDRPSLVLLDNHMPNMTGLEVLRRLRESAPEVSVILMSGVLDAETCETAMSLGAVACLQKPIAFSQLQQCLAEHVGGGREKRRVLVVDDHEIVRRTVAFLLREEADIEVVGEAGDGKLAVQMARSVNPDVVLMDINMPVMNGIDATRAIRAACPGVSVIGLSMYNKNEQATPMLEAGAAAYVSKTEAPEVLLAVIRACPPARPA